MQNYIFIFFAYIFTKKILMISDNIFFATGFF